MSTEYSRYFSALADFNAGNPIDDRDLDGEFDAIKTALNQKVLCKATAPSSPIDGQTWIDTTTKHLKRYRNSEWVIQGIVHVGTSAPATVQSGDVWIDTSGSQNLLKLRNQANDAWISLGALPKNWRNGLRCKQASTSTITVELGMLEVNGASIEKTTETTLNLATDAHWAGGTNLRATSTYGYIGVDGSGNIKMHTTAPSHSDYAVSNTSGKKRYATWSGTVYRIIGWFYMNATGSGELSSFEVGNIAEIGVTNSVVRAGSTDDTINDTTYGSDLTECEIHFYTSGGPVRMDAGLYISNTAAGIDIVTALFDDGADIANSERGTNFGGAGQTGQLHLHYQTTYAQGPKTINVQMKVGASSLTVSEKTVILTELP